jgi:hypothetical protein
MRHCYCWLIDSRPVCRLHGLVSVPTAHHISVDILFMKLFFFRSFYILQDIIIASSLAAACHVSFGRPSHALHANWHLPSPRPPISPPSLSPSLPPLLPLSDRRVQPRGSSTLHYFGGFGIRFASGHFCAPSITVNQGQSLKHSALL